MNAINQTGIDEFGRDNSLRINTYMPLSTYMSNIISKITTMGWVDFDYEQEEEEELREQLRETENYKIFLKEQLKERKELFSKGEYTLEPGEILE
jgi:hypothetical protein